MATYYVDSVNGSDANAGTSEALAKQTLSAACALLASAGDILYVQAGGNYTLTSAVSITQDGSASGRYLIEGYTTIPGARDGRPTITSATNSVNLFELNAANFFRFRHLKFTHTAGTRGAAFAGVTAGSLDIAIEDCEFDGCSYAISAASREFGNLLFARNRVVNCTSGGITNASTASVLIDNIFRNNTGNAFDSAGATITRGLIYRNIFADNGRGVYDTGTTRSNYWDIVGNIFYSNTNDGFRSDETTGFAAVNLLNNIFYGNGAYGINLQDGQTENDARAWLNRENAYGSNSSGARNNLSAGIDDITLTADPFVDAANGDFNINNTAGGGAALRAVTFTLSP